ncbi:hypothetical protein SDC9_122497 [bioreactor metagenome]|uniref:Uncharacterized protein n=1 Tax=bioreactor metagenome TaxID=1076179 RepID=A0A645CF08_9ZZZZ
MNLCILLKLNIMFKGGVTLIMKNLQFNKKAKLSIIVIGLILISSLTLISLSRRNPGEKNLVKFINSHYTVTSEDIDRFNKYQVDGITDEYLAQYNKDAEEMKGFMTKEGFRVYTADRIYLTTVIKPASMDTLVQVKNIKPKFVKIQEDGILSYDVTFTIVTKSRKENEEFEKNLTKRFFMSKEGNQWKVNEFNKFDMLI